ncbi:MAG TPA: ABC transporter substrate-binding protein [Casimicrobiaceae bacterium]|nr:ABC transporter substrate-binding protein [Casimicrobiaceae bacterium]
MRRISVRYVVVVTLVLCGAPAVAMGQSSANVHRIGWLGTSSQPARPDRDAADLVQGLRDFGYIEGRNLVIEYRYAGGNADRLRELAADLARLPVEVIVTSGEPAALAAKRATRAIPIVATEIALDPVRSGLVASLGRPGGNVTGLATLSEELWQKRLGLLKDAVPRLSRVAVILNPANPGNAYCIEEIKAIAPGIGLQVRDLEVSDAGTLDRALASIAKEPPDALVTCWDSVTLVHATAIADFALQRRLPTIAPLREYVQAGQLMSFGTSLSAQRRRTAYYVDKILKGTRPADMPFEMPSLFELVVNLRTAKALGLTLPPAFVLLADDVIK